MAKVLVFCIPAHGHVNPTLPLVEELVKRGETVIYYCAPEFADPISRTGAEFRPLNSRYDDSAAGISPNVVTILRLGMDANRAVTPHVIEELEREKPDYVIHDIMVAFGRVIKKVHHIPTVVSVPVFAYDDRTIGTLPLRFKTALGLMMLSAFPDVIRFLIAARWYKREFGLKISEFLSLTGCYSDLNIVYTSEFFQPVPPPQTGRFHFIGPSLYPKREIGDFPLKRLQDRKVLYISLGTAFSRRPRFYRRCFEAFGGGDLQVVLSVGSLIDISRLEPIPKNFIVRNHVPQQQVLEHTNVFISHGGMNSTAEAILCGVPLVLFPQAADQYLVARRIEELGAGIHLGRPTVKALRRAVIRVMSENGFNKNCAAIADSFRRAGGAERGARMIIEFMKKG